jgi:glycosyltransferase involved in cell wall biosynthesis
LADESFCLVTTFYPPHSFGGDAVHVANLARGLARRGRRVRVVHSPAAYRALGGIQHEERGTPEARADADAGVEVVAAPTGRAGVAATYLTGHAVGYRSALADLVDGFDVVHFHNPSLLGGASALGMGSGLTLYTATEHWLVCPTHVLFRYGREVCTAPTCWRCTLSYRRPPQLWRSTGLLERAMGRVDLLLCPSRFTAARHREAFPEVLTEVLPLFFGPAPEELAAAEVEAGADAAESGSRPFVLFLGRLEPVKGADRLVAAALGLKGADLVVAGSGSQEEQIRRLARHAPHVRFIGSVGRARALALCRQALAVVVPSAGYETFGGVAVEAMALGTPALVRRLGALPELVTTGGGWTFADDTELATRLQHLADHPEEATAAAGEARAVYAARFSPEVLFERYFQLVGRAAAAGPPADGQQ